MKIKLCCSILKINSINKLKEELEELNHEVIIDDEIIQFENNNINISAIEQIRKRDPRSPIVDKLMTNLINIQLTKIKDCDSILVVNEVNEIISSNLIFQIISAWALDKHIYYMNNIFNINDRTFSTVKFIPAIILKNDLEKIKIKDEIYSLDKILNNLPTSSNKKRLKQRK